MNQTVIEQVEYDTLGRLVAVKARYGAIVTRGCVEQWITTLALPLEADVATEAFSAYCPNSTRNTSRRLWRACGLATSRSARRCRGCGTRHYVVYTDEAQIDNFSCKACRGPVAKTPITTYNTDPEVQ